MSDTSSVDTMHSALLNDCILDVQGYEGDWDILPHDKNPANNYFHDTVLPPTADYPISGDIVSTVQPYPPNEFPRPPSVRTNSMRTSDDKSKSTIPPSRRKSVNEDDGGDILLKRRDQNRAAQRAYRERKVRRIKDLESKLAEAVDQVKNLRCENQITKASLQRVMSQNNQLRAIVEHLFRSHLVHNPQASVMLTEPVSAGSAHELLDGDAHPTPWQATGDPYCLCT